MYRLTEGIVLAKVGGERLLIATRPAWNKCPYIKAISPINAMFWQSLEQGMSKELILQELHEKIGIKEDALKEKYTDFINELRKEGYLSGEENA